MSVAGFQLSDTCARFSDAVSDAGAEGAWVSAGCGCTTLVAFPETPWFALPASDVFTCTLYVPAAVAAGGVTTNVALLAAPGDRLTVGGEIVLDQPEGAMPPSVSVLAAQLALSRFVIVTA